MRKLLLFILCMFLGTVAWADVVVKDVTAQQRWPWNGIVDIKYSVECDDADTYIELQFSAYDSVRKKNYEIKALTGDGVFGCVKSGGPYSVEWDAGIDLPNKNIKDLEITISGKVADCKYLVVDLSAGTSVASYPIRYTDKEPDLTDDKCRSTELWLRRIPAGRFAMGCPVEESGNNIFELEHNVTLSKDFYIGVFEVTQMQWALVMGNNPSIYKGDCRPVENISYDDIRGTCVQAGAGWPAYGHIVDASSFIGKLQKKTGLVLDLPTEAQWEYACRAGTNSALNSGKNLSNSIGECVEMDEVGRYRCNQSDGNGGFGEHTKVGCYKPNFWGLYDMHGNISELCLNWSGDLNYNELEENTDKEDPTGPAIGIYRRTRGGHWDSDPKSCRSASTMGCLSPSDRYATAGLRVAMLPSPIRQYLVIDLSGGADATSYPVRYTDDKPVLADDKCSTTELWLRRIPADSVFSKGSPVKELGRSSSETQHLVKLSKDFYIGVFEVTQKQWELVMGNNPSTYKGYSRPVESVSYVDIRGNGTTAGAGWPKYGHTVDDASFMGKLQKKTGLVLDLPTEAQWEYACRAGTSTALNSGMDLSNIESCVEMNEVGRYSGNINDGKGGCGEHTKVGNYKPNLWGLYDMHGNILEWCLDWWSNSNGSNMIDPVGAVSGAIRILRGGSWRSSAHDCRSAMRCATKPSGCENYYGFRIAMLSSQFVMETIVYDTLYSISGTSVMNLDTREGVMIIGGKTWISPIGNSQGTRLLVYGDDVRGWSTSSPLWDSASIEDDCITLMLANGNTVVNKREMLVLNNSDVMLHGGTLVADERWDAGKVHIVQGDIIVPVGVTLSITADTVVKFSPYTEIVVEGTLNATKAIFTALADDNYGGDTDHNQADTVDYSKFGIIGTGMKFISDTYRCNGSERIPKWKYMVCSDGGVHIIAYNGNEENVVVPAVLDGHPVVSISSLAFRANNTISNVMLPIGVRLPERNVFAELKVLKNVDYTLEGVRRDFGSDVTVNVNGEWHEITVSLIPGWNMIAIPQGELAAESKKKLLNLKSVFYYDSVARTFLGANDIETGKAYWIFSHIRTSFKVRCK